MSAPADGFLQVVMKRGRSGKTCPGQKDRILPRPDDRFENLRFANPEPDRKADCGQVKGERGSPASAADDAGVFHETAAFSPNFRSVPLKRRSDIRSMPEQDHDDEGRLPRISGPGGSGES